MATQEDTTVLEKPKSGGKKLLIIGLLVGLLIGGGGGVGAFMMMKKSENHETVHVEEPIKEEPKTNPQFVKVERLTIPITHNNRVLGNITADFSMEVDGDENKMIVIRNLPEIRDNMLRHFSVTAVGKDNHPKSIDYDKLKQTLLDISNDVLHEPIVLKVMVVQIRQF
ncbi:MAG: hypothetical protein K9G26_07305 [Emcibacter sp.]|nr:hypothetical protein [Emcibacter sp.]